MAAAATHHPCLPLQPLLPHRPHQHRPIRFPRLRFPLLMSAHFAFLGTSFPSFTLQIKPQFGDFSIKKLAASPAPSLPAPFHPDPTKPNGELHVVGVENGPPPPLLSELHGGGVGFLSGAAVDARMALPVAGWAVVKFQWGVNFNERKLLFLTMDKIAVERLDFNERLKEESKKSSGGGNDDSTSKIAGELDILKGMCFWIGREVEVLRKENRWMKEWIEELRLGGTRRTPRDIEIPGKKPMEIAEDGWRKKKNGGGEDRTAEAKPGSASSEASANDVGEELKRALKAVAA